MKNLMKSVNRFRHLSLLFIIIVLGVTNEAQACICVAPSTPGSPAASSIVSDGFTYSWSASSTSCGTMGSYDIDISLTNFGASISGYPINTGSTATSKAISGLGCGTTYYVRVRGKLSNCGGMVGNWSSVISVTPTASPCPASCTDGIQNQGESPADCGGPCSSCSCTDGKQNQGETGVDCGGPCPLSCTVPPPTTSSSSCPASANSPIRAVTCDQVGTSAFDLSGGEVDFQTGTATTPSPAPSGCTGVGSYNGGSWVRYNLDPGVTNANFKWTGTNSSGGGNHAVYVQFYQGTCGALVPVGVNGSASCQQAMGFSMGLPTFYNTQANGLNSSQDLYAFIWDDKATAYDFGVDVSGSVSNPNNTCGGAVTSPDLCNVGATGDTWQGDLLHGPTNLGAACNGGTWRSNENTTWYTAVASSTTASISITNITCNDGTAGSYQFMVLTSCACTGISNYPSNSCFKGCAAGTGTINLTSLTPGATYYIATDGFAGDVCKGQFLAPGLYVCSDTTKPYIWGSSSGIDVASGGASQKTFTITMSEPIQCSTLKSCSGCAANNCSNCDFSLQRNGSSKDTAGYRIISATALNCVGDTTRTISITLNDTPAVTNGVADYDNLWRIVPNNSQGSITLRDTCNNFLLAGNTGQGALILPVDLILFNGWYENKIIKLNWVTASERNNATFIIEKSTDGRNFVELGRKPGAGNSGSIKSYFLTDHKPVYGINYYRLSSIDFNGDKHQIGNILPVEMNEVFSFNINSIKPIPAIDKITISVSSDTEDNTSELFIFDISGRQIYKENRPLLTGENELNMDVSFLNKGVYFISLKKQGQSVYSKLVKY